MPIDEQVVEFYATLFDSIFSEPFQARVEQVLKHKRVLRQVEEAADAASQSLTRFLVNQQLAEEQVAAILASFNTLTRLLKLDDIANPKVNPERLLPIFSFLCRVPASCSKHIMRLFTGSGAGADARRAGDGGVAEAQLCDHL